MARLAQPGQTISQRRDFTRQFLCLLQVAVSYAVPKILEPRVSAKTGCELRRNLQKTHKNSAEFLTIFLHGSGTIGECPVFGARPTPGTLAATAHLRNSGDGPQTFTVYATADGAVDRGEGIPLRSGTLPYGVSAGSPAIATVDLSGDDEQ